MQSVAGADCVLPNNTSTTSVDAARVGACDYGLEVEAQADLEAQPAPVGPGAGGRVDKQ